MTMTPEPANPGGNPFIKEFKAQRYYSGWLMMPNPPSWVFRYFQTRPESLQRSNDFSIISPNDDYWEFHTRDIYWWMTHFDAWNVDYTVYLDALQGG